MRPGANAGVGGAAILVALLLALGAHAQDEAMKDESGVQGEEVAPEDQGSVEEGSGDEGLGQDEGVVEEEVAAPPFRYEDLSPEDQARIDDFIVNNTIGTLYHELGHAFIDLYQLPVLGREEDAADSLSVLLMLQRQPDDVLDQMVQDSAEIYYMTEEESQALGYVPDYSDVHGLDLQRYYSVVCIVYGSNPERFQELADYEELPADRQGGCSFDYEQAANSWGMLLEPHLADGQAEGGKVLMGFDPANETHARLAALVESSELVQAFPVDIEGAYVLPHDLTVTFGHCEEENAWYYSADKSITMCYEILESFERMIANNLVNGWQ